HYSALITGSHNSGIRFNADEDTDVALFGDYDGDVGIFGDDNTDIGIFGDTFHGQIDIGSHGAHALLDSAGHKVAGTGINVTARTFADAVNIAGDDNTDIGIFGDTFNSAVTIGASSSTASTASFKGQDWARAGSFKGQVLVTGDDNSDIGIFGDEFDDVGI